MSTRPKAFLKQAKSHKKKEQIPETADEYQAVGVEHEDAAGKWRAGDPVKSMRFFQRALDVYEQGLEKYPRSFDLAYNKARVQLEVATHPVLVKQLQRPVIEMLGTALVSHQYALSLNQDNADTLFNTAQVLTSVAEETIKRDDGSEMEALKCLQEALELQNRCLGVQEFRYQEALQRRRRDVEQSGSQPSEKDDDDDDDDGGAKVDTEETGIEDERWFTIVEPITEDVLIDTVTAQLGTLTTLCGLLGSTSETNISTTLSWVEEFSSPLLKVKLPGYLRNAPGRAPEATLTRAVFSSSLLEAGFRTGSIDAQTYKCERDGAFGVPELNLQTSPEALLANAASLMFFGVALAESGDTGHAARAWNALSSAIANLVAVPQVHGASAEDIARSHLLRGNASLLQHRLSQPPTSYEPAVSNAAQLLKNAEVFYRNASKLSPDDDDKAVAAFRSALAQILQDGDRSRVVAMTPGRTDRWRVEQWEEAMGDGLVSENIPDVATT